MAEKVVEQRREIQVISTPGQLIHQAIASGAGVEILERLMALQERWEKNQAKKEYDTAMADLRSDLPPILKSRTVDYKSAKGHTYYKYEDLQAVAEVLSPIMAKHGLSFRWRTQTDTPTAVSVTCIVSHRDGHSEETTLTAANDQSGNKNDIQALGSAVTYLQRYTLKAALGVAAATDDDGERTGERKAKETPPPVRQDPKEPAWFDMIQGLVQEIIEQKSPPNSDRKWTRYGVSVDGTIYSTFDTKAADVAHKAQIEKKLVEIVFTKVALKSGRTVNNIDQIVVVEVEDEPDDDVPF